MCHSITFTEVNQYGGVGTENNHVNMYVISDTNLSYYQTAYNQNSYGGMAYYTSETCGYNGESVCKNDYESSEVKYVVNAWKVDQAPAATDSRLVSKDEIEIEERDYDCCGGCGSCIATGEFVKYDWMYNSNYSYWTITSDPDSLSRVYSVESNGRIDKRSISSGYGSAIVVVRPVIVLPKSAL